MKSYYKHCTCFKNESELHWTVNQLHADTTNPASDYLNFRRSLTLIIALIWGTLFGSSVIGINLAVNQNLNPIENPTEIKARLVLEKMKHSSKPEGNQRTTDLVKFVKEKN